MAFPLFMGMCIAEISDQGNQGNQSSLPIHGDKSTVCWFSVKRNTMACLFCKWSWIVSQRLSQNNKYVNRANFIKQKKESTFFTLLFYLPYLFMLLWYDGNVRRKCDVIGWYGVAVRTWKRFSFQKYISNHYIYKFKKYACIYNAD